jgi:hypothetical protein
VGLEQASQFASVIGAPLAIIALLYAALQLRQSVAIARGQFMLELEKMIETHNDVHIRLRPGGDWTKGAMGPTSEAEWSKIEDYMGFFEHCELLLRDGSVRLASFKALFGYRVENIMANETIVLAKLVREGASWHLFLDLLDRLNLPRPAPALSVD